MCEALDAPPPCSVRANPARHHVPDGERVPWCEHGRYLDKRPVFTLDPFFHAGAYYVQEASSMMVEQAFKATDSPTRKYSRWTYARRQVERAGICGTFSIPPRY
ncbi:MAG: hypothetical protein IPH53_04810 [Flavobacteriales bacterium]|nr:hypothetical protein [Flavobacteriales bacterium]